ncbi:MAG: DUF1800 domain-containing protein [Zoogloea oleivorans]|uniref:DUF1800 domain-containing protein n=1 Tax=Zoogloea oleivorans TaxID=1552750 RepID=UPI002A367516|nr:DUF1800 domain-containing protein [Zoogloea oleivorans]MDY0038348.1 DUF1800 domain-containing protein [Zoogloea oleivorans]
MSSGSAVVTAQFRTDSTGLLRLDPEQLGVKRYALRAASSLDGSLKQSATYETGGNQRFVVGGAGVTIRVADQVSGSYLPGLEVQAYEKLATGQKVQVAKRSTDAEGLVKFDLEGLGTGKVFVFHTRPYGQWVISDEVSSATNYRFWVGKLQVQLINGQSGQPLAGQEVVLRRWRASGVHEYEAVATSDAQGWLKLDPQAMATESYVLTAPSATDGQVKVSEAYRAAGPHRFVLGNPAVNVVVRDGVSGQALPQVWVEAWERLVGGQEVLSLKRQTDAGGVVKFDLDGVGSGRKYVFKAQPYLQPIRSAEVTSAGEVVLRAGQLQVQLIDGRTDTAYAGQSVELLDVSSGSAVVTAQFRTDSTGLLRLDPEQLGVKRYALRAASSLDGSLKQSATYETGGNQRFVVGGAGVTIRVADQVSGSYLPGLEVQAYEKLATGQKVQVAKRSTDAEGLVKFDLEGLGTGKVFVFHTRPYGQWVISDEVSSATNYRFWVGKLQVQLINGQSGQPLAGQEVVLRRWRASGVHEYEAVATSDAQGWLKLDPQAMATESYVLTAPSATDGQVKVSEAYRAAGPHRFVLGNPAVNVVVRDGVSGQALPQVWVEAWERLVGGQEVLSLKRQTDAGGVVKFDLDGVGSGRKYVFKAQPYLQPIRSAEVTSAGEVVLRAGQLQVQLIDGRTDTAYAGQSVELLDVSSGSAVVTAQFRTDSTGLLRLDPEQLGVKRYALRAASSFDGSLKQSATYVAAGNFVFHIGGAGLAVRLVDHTTEENLAGHPLQAFELVADGNEQLRDTRISDSTGLVRFDLDGLGSGRRFVVRAQPYGYPVKSDVIDAAGTSYRLRAGKSPVTLIDAVSGGVLPSVQLIAREKMSDGTLGAAVGGTTGADGIVRFDLAGLGSGSVYLFEARNPFGDGESYFSEPVSAIGAISFAIARGDRQPPDQTAPSVSISSPSSGKRVAFGGFTLDGTADDAEGLASVRVQLRLPSGKTVERPAVFRPSTRTWSAASGELPATESGVLTVTVVATDKALNQGTASITLNLLPDISPPTISQLTHSSGAEVPYGGFMIHGRIDDESLAPTLRAEISGGGMASAISKMVEVDQTSGRWSLAVVPEDRFSDVGLVIQLTAVDAARNHAVQTLSLTPSDRFGKTWHFLLRTSFGVDGHAYQEALATGVETYLQKQLSPDSVSDEKYLQRQANWYGEGTELSTGFLRRAVFSDRQLLEVMTWFWDNHFNTNYATHLNSAFEASERDAFRASALGNFRTLLEISAKSPAMLYTLDGRLNRKGIPNENYARELMELHSMGVDGGYTQLDVQEVARALTGWTVKDGSFYFSDVWHDFDSKSVLGRTIAAGGGISDGEQVLDSLANHPSTARFICTKLTRFFVADQPPATLVSRCTSVFVANAGSPVQIAMVLSEILRSPEFLSESNRQTKIKTPLEFVVGAVRNLQGEFKADDLGIEVARQGMPLFRNPAPTGYTDVGTAWVTMGMLHARARFSERLLKSGTGLEQTQFAIAEGIEQDGIVTSEGVAGRVLERLLGPGFTRRHLELALSILTEDGSYPWRPGAVDRESRVRQLARMLMNVPEYHYQ